MDSIDITPESLRLFANSDVKLKVVSALDKLLTEQVLDKISVESICNEADVSRATFYRNFHDKYDIVSWFLRYIHYNGIDQIGRTLNWYDGYYISEATLVRNLNFFTEAAKSNDMNSLDRIAPRLRRNALIHTLTEYHGIEITEHLRLLINSTILTETHFFPAWHYGKYSCTLDEACHWMIECIPKELFDMLNTPVHKQQR